MFHPQGPTFFELAKQALSSTETGYDLLAPKFDYTPFRTPDFVLNAVREKLASESKPFSQGLDLCCGTGAGMQMMLDLGCEKVTGIDFSRGMVDQAKLNLKPKPEQSFEFHLGDVLEPHFHQQFDLAVSFGAFGHIRPQQENQFIKIISQALKPGGRFVFVTTSRIPIWSPMFWLAKGFNASMHLRNLVRRPKFIMFYLTFLWPEIQSRFEQNGMTATGEPMFPGQSRFKYLLYVTAVKND